MISTKSEGYRGRDVATDQFYCDRGHHHILLFFKGVEVLNSWSSSLFSLGLLYVPAYRSNGTREHHKAAGCIIWFLHRSFTVLIVWKHLFSQLSGVSTRWRMVNISFCQLLPWYWKSKALTAAIFYNSVGPCGISWQECASFGHWSLQHWWTQSGGARKHKILQGVFGRDGMLNFCCLEGHMYLSYLRI